MVSLAAVLEPLLAKVPALTGRPGGPAPLTACRQVSQPHSLDLDLELSLATSPCSLEDCCVH